ncbi:Ribosomal protein [Mycena indigotica]|uniref:Ribosomal protein n=1 Tax=Mycena indigotica TaxID=2126181 RepID=A0A8H6SYW4_9AGAR|nr:Ribosomal protein [Mycena indigotica]XP_037221856.1 Ribosomal protein [Mycena indigotica]KAF7306834.1 Ribosomal protein [Mycena indigotica]KAF7306837.1 Ribosomal protein [Mycena indigotica]
MPMRLRLALHGRAHAKVFHLVAVDGRARRDARPAELLGVYNPHVELGQKNKTVQWSVDRIRYWLHVGAVPSGAAVRLLELGNILKPGSVYHPREGQKQKSQKQKLQPPQTLADIREKLANQL